MSEPVVGPPVVDVAVTTPVTVTEPVDPVDEILSRWPVNGDRKRRSFCPRLSAAPLPAK